MSRHEYDVLEHEFVSPREAKHLLADGTPRPREHDQVAQDSAIMDVAAKRRREMVDAIFDVAADPARGFITDFAHPPKSDLQLREAQDFEAAHQRRELLASRGTEILRPGAPWPDERPQRRDPPPAHYAPLGEWTVKNILRDARDRCLIASDNRREVVRFFYSPTTGRCLGTAASISGAAGQAVDFTQFIAVDIPYLEISLSGVRWSLGRPVRYDGGGES
jgi:hypothetical protein